MKPKQLPSLELEKPLWKRGVLYIAGLDEAGRGSWAGPVSAAAVILPDHENILKTLEGVRDSKRMTIHQRGIWAEKIKENALSWGVGFASNQEIDEIGIVPATRLAMQRALDQLEPQPQFLLIDALRLNEIEIEQASYKKGDAICLSIAAASVIAKTERDALMIEASRKHPEYFFERHKGYGTKAHQKALREKGPCDIHRKSFAPVRIRLEKEGNKSNDQKEA